MKSSEFHLCVQHMFSFAWHKEWKQGESASLAHRGETNLLILSALHVKIKSDVLR